MLTMTTRDLWGSRSPRHDVLEASTLWRVACGVCGVYLPRVAGTNKIQSFCAINPETWKPGSDDLEIAFDSG